ncbi:uncharacterized protein PHALS_15195 [Plasmopara halstedii]|uniref:Uncharacterized protein n=1 Tax=Plasmopara halstedii TaxID=4781 RepID=A0A0N7L879_PLAHL|nr:uncharacterized protein PHALS_15195 [Plasmopara halstedii]CEG49123.1 hypothetical protein PHALS_15195 [Plasmopara halstedii]|eukprot:XP_024585492.1 hypothetical protein PHALS_15195 [Plasmopara halstedii]
MLFFSLRFNRVSSFFSMVCHLYFSDTENNDYDTMYHNVVHRRCLSVHHCNRNAAACGLPAE